MFEQFVAAALIVVVPVYGVWSWKRFERELARDQDNARLSSYAETILIEWGLAIGAIAAFVVAGRSMAELGLAAPASPAFGATALLAALVSILLLQQIPAVRAGGVDESSIRSQLGSLEKMMPRTTGERAIFSVVAVSAGVCEEILYRGFLMHLFAPALGPWGAVAASSLVFGLAHAYQGGAGIVKSSVVGLILASSYVISGSIWPAILLHVAVDIQGGWVGYEVFGRHRSGDPVPA